jgi:cytochrome c peroxidase
MSTRHVVLVLASAMALWGCSDDAVNSATPDPTVRSAALATSPDVISVGKQIFFDQRLSVNGNQSCASCHAPEWGWTGPDPRINTAGAVYEGSIPGAFGDRKPPSSAYATSSPVFHLEGDLFEGGNFWDGRATGERLGNPSAEQALGPFLNPAEQALARPADVVSRVCDGPYGAAFRAVAGTAACEPQNTASTYDYIGNAIAAFENSAESNAFTSKFDAFRAGRATLTAEELQGLALFRGKGKCVLCHVLDDRARGLGRGVTHDEGPVFTDFTFDNLGIPKNPANPQGPGYTDKGLGGFLQSRADYAAYAQANWGKQKVPTLRNVDLRPTPTSVKAYGHNGYFKSLESIVHFYNTRDVKPTCMGDFTEAQALAANCWPAPEVPETVNRDELGDLGLSAAQERAIVAFLRTLSDGYIR